MEKAKILEATLSQAGKILYGNILADIPTLLLGHPGLGKTTILRQLGKVLAERFTGGVYVLSTREFNPIDLAGLWLVDQTTWTTKRAPSDVLPYDKPVLILVDELGDALSFEQSSWYRLVLEHTLGNQQLAPGSYVACASNRPEDSAASNELSSALYGRCCCVTIRADFGALKSYAIKNNWNPTLIGFIGAFGSDYVDNGFNSDLPYCGSTPRDFERLNRLEAGKHISSDNEIALLQIVGNIDHVAGEKYFAFRQLAVPSAELVLQDPASAPILDSMEKQSLYGACVIAACPQEHKAYQAVTTYALRLNRVAGIALCFDLATRFKDYKQTSAFAQAATAFHELLG
jgi:energy-coupling factor transporter ATP-binding protein EcfA2